MIDAVIRTGGKQYRVHEGSVLDVATMDAAPGSRVELRDVLLVADGDNVTVGSPNVDDAVVVAEVVEHGKGKKVISFKYKAKTRYRRKRGHRQGFTKLAIQEISVGGVSSRPAPSRRRRRAAEPEQPAEEAAPEQAEQPQGFAGRAEEGPPPAAAPTAEAPAETAQSEAPPTPRRRTRRTSTESPESGESSESTPRRAPRRRRTASTESESGTETPSEDQPQG